MYADLNHTFVLKLNSSLLKKFVTELKMRDRVILIYDSRKTPHLRKEFKETFDRTLKGVPESHRKFFIAATYDLAHNTRHGFDILHQDIPIVRFYRKEDF